MFHTVEAVTASFIVSIFTAFCHVRTGITCWNERNSKPFIRFGYDLLVVYTFYDWID